MIILLGIGAWVVAVILYAIPILTACSFIYEWDGLLKLVMMLISIIELGMLAYFVGDIADRRENENDER